LLAESSLPSTWPWVIVYAVLITLICHGVYLGSKAIDPGAPVHLEVLLPAFALGCVMKRSPGHDPHVDDTRPGHQEGPAEADEQRVATIVSAVFMVLVGLSMPSIMSNTDTHSVLPFAGVAPSVLTEKNAFPGWGVIALHVLAITAISNVGKMLPAVCYRRRASRKQRLALAVGMFPRGEVGAGVLVVALSYGIAGPALTVAVLSLAFNLMGTGLFILIVKKLLASDAPSKAQSAM